MLIFSANIHIVWLDTVGLVTLKSLLLLNVRIAVIDGVVPPPPAAVQAITLPK